jgi:oxygen-independent coproporphyrinogen-3 oxidase
VSLGLYLHIPFCQAICSYCNFNRGLLDGDLKRRYVDALEREVRSGPGPKAQGPRRESADTIFFGGGTPSLLEPDEVRRLLAACRETFDVDAGAEVTLETNPETASAARLEGFREAGVNRLSFGVQSFDDGELARLGRLHSAERAKEAVRAARAAGVENVSIDLMCWLPGQSLASWLGTVEQTIDLGLEHVSIYLLELYPNAPLQDALARGAADPQAAEDIAAEMYLRGFERLHGAGFTQYEISNTARAGRPSRHNLKYWQGGRWLGFGCGAHSTVDGRRWKNIASTTAYVERMAAGEPVAVDEQVLSRQGQFEERLFLGLRLSAGVSRREVEAVFGIDPWRRHEDRFSLFVEAGLMWTSGDSFGLTREGMLMANEALVAVV